jgi:hypothetical protein
MTKDEVKALAVQALTSIDAGLICLADLGAQHGIPDSEIKSVAGFFVDAAGDLAQIRDDPSP